MNGLKITCHKSWNKKVGVDFFSLSFWMYLMTNIRLKEILIITSVCNSYIIVIIEVFFLLSTYLGYNEIQAQFSLSFDFIIYYIVYTYGYENLINYLIVLKKF